MSHLPERQRSQQQYRVRNRALDHRGGNAELDKRFDVAMNGAGKAPDLGREPGGGDELDGVPVVGGDTRETCLDSIDPSCVERNRDLELLLRREHNTDG